MIVGRKISEQLSQASWIRRMFEEGNRLRAERGAENVFDFTLGNPQDTPPSEVLDALRRLAGDPRMHGYMPNAGFPAVREVIAERLSRRTGLPYTAGHVIMTCGAAGALNTLLKSVLDPGDEAIVLVPYFPEYRFYIENHAGIVREVQTGTDFLPDFDRLAAAIHARTKAIVVNSPNNPSGVVYSREVLAELQDLLTRLGSQALVVNDEPYDALVFDGGKLPPAPAIIERCATAYSWSKSQAIAGERVGYLALSPRIAEWEALRDACTFANRTLGYINAPAIWQLVEAEAGEARIDISAYEEKRNIFCDALSRIGYDLTRPQGTFYLFPKSPVDDDVAFIRTLLGEGILAVPGSGFGRSGYFRLSLTGPRESMLRSFPAFERALEAARLRAKMSVR